MSLPLHGQLPVEGRVLDEEGRPVAEAQVVASPGGRETATDARGRFRFVVPRPGEYRVDVAMMGYERTERTIRVGQAGISGLEIRVRTTPLAIGGLEVTASPGPREGSALGRATAQLAGLALERELSGTVAQTLRYQPGVAVRWNGPSAALPVLRGLTGDRVLMLQDGQRTGDLAGSADDHGVTVDPLSAQRVEVVRGPATLLYGNNALGGVVNVISGDVGGALPLSVQTTVRAQTETAYPGYGIGAHVAVPVTGGFAVSARGGLRESGDMRIAPDPVLGDRLGNTDASNRHASMTLRGVTTEWSGSVAVRGYAFEYGLPVAPGLDPVDLAGDRVEVTGRAERRLPLWGLDQVRVDGALQWYGHDELGDDGSLQQRFSLATRTFNVVAGHAAHGRLGEGSLGVSLLRKDYDATGPSALTPGARSAAWGVFGFEELELQRAVALQLGARYDHYAVTSRGSDKFGPGRERTFSAVSVSGGLVFRPLAGVTAGLTGSTSFRAPAVEELFSAAPHAGTGAVEFGDPSLDAERGRGAEALLQVRGSRVNATAAAYVTRIDNFVNLAARGDTLVGGVRLPVFVYAQQPATLKGMEASVELAVAREWLVGVRGDVLHTEQQDGAPLSFMPPPRAGVTVRWTGHVFSAGGDVHHEAAQRRTGMAEETPTDAHTLLRLDASARFRAGGRLHTVTLRVDNVFDEAHREATSRIRDFAPSAGRNIALGYRVIF